MSRRTTELSEMLVPAISALGYTLWGIEYVPQGKNSLLRVYLDKEGGIDIEDCARASRQISSILDVEDPISGEYTLEVSSPGVDRVLFNLDQLREYLGWHVQLRLTENFENRRKFAGQLKAIVDDEIVLIIGDEEYTIPYELIEKANLESRV
ncbi:MAG: ribosome maturation factor RimP [Gammaproteobacteria bacterium]|nr:ribosome maturation factor RimP [Gammaproteobacteria bacterium]